MRLRLDVTDSGGARLTPGLDAGILADVLGGFVGTLEPFSREVVSVALSFLPEDEMRALNARYRDIDEPTDVLSFPMWEENGVFSPPDWPDLPLGDVVVCPEIVRKNAEAQGNGYEEETVLVIIHGVLHLIGFDHDDDERCGVMWREQETLVMRYFERIRGGLMSE